MPVNQWSNFLFKKQNGGQYGGVQGLRKFFQLRVPWFNFHLSLIFSYKRVTIIFQSHTFFDQKLSYFNHAPFSIKNINALHLLGLNYSYQLKYRYKVVIAKLSFLLSVLIVYLNEICQFQHKCKWMGKYLIYVYLCFWHLKTWYLLFSQNYLQKRYKQERCVSK